MNEQYERIREHVTVLYGADRAQEVFDEIVKLIESVDIPVSQHSHYMQKYSEGHPDYENFFIEMDPDEDVSAVTRPRTLPLLHDYETHEGKTWLWTTFSKDQVDLNFSNPKVLIEIVRVMLSYAEKGASMLRLDAIPYAWKIPGTSCIHLDETHRFGEAVPRCLEGAVGCGHAARSGVCRHEAHAQGSDAPDGVQSGGSADSL